VSTEAREWDRLPEESGPAFAAFRTFLELGCERTVVAAARQVGKSERLLRKWVSRHRWWARARAFDNATARAAEEDRRAAERRRLDYAGRVERIAWARLAQLVRTDPVTGEMVVDSSFTPREALAVIRLMVELTQRGGPEPAEEEGQAVAGRLRPLSSAQLEGLIAYITANAQEEKTNVETTSQPEGPPVGDGAGEAE
jgi:transposase-like protein